MTPQHPVAPEGETDASGLRELLAAATPSGQWRAVEGDLEGGTLNDYIATLLTNRQNDRTSTGRLFLTLAPNDIDPELGAEVVPALCGDGPRAQANARLIAAAINALPSLLADLDALRERLRVVEGERDAAQLALGEQADIEREAFGRGVEWASGAGMRQRWEAAEARAESAEAAHAALRAEGARKAIYELGLWCGECNPTDPDDDCCVVDHRVRALLAGGGA